MLLPYAYLMNTNENKHRIIDDGWRNVFKNILNVSSAPKSTTSTRSKAKKSYQVNIQSMAVWLANVTGQITTVKEIPKKKMSNLMPVSVRNDAKDNDIKVFTIFQNINQAHSIAPDINTPTTSVPMKEFTYSRTDRMLSFEDNSNRQVESLQEIAQYMSVRHEIITDMLSTFTDENTYIQNLKKFARFEEAVKIGDNSWKFFQKTKNYNTKVLTKCDFMLDIWPQCGQTIL